MELIDRLIYHEQRSDAELVRQAFLAARNSLDPSTQVGAVLAAGIDRPVAAGWNHRLASAGEPSSREEKASTTVHAELAALLCAARHGVPTLGATLACTWACCEDCARAIVASGVSRVLCSRRAYESTPERWRGRVEAGSRILLDEGVRFDLVDHSFGAHSIRFDGWFFTP